MFWLAKGVDGFRYDMAEMVPVEFWSYMNSSIKMKNPDTFLLAEVYNPDLYAKVLKGEIVSLGGAHNKNIDIDEMDTRVDPYEQLIVWNPEDKEIIGGYRFIRGEDLEIIAKDEVHSPTSRLFSFTEKFINEYLPVTIELGRSFVQPEYQPSKNIRRGMYALDNIWDGLGAIIFDNPDVKYLFGKITMYPHFDTLSKELLMRFMHKYFPDPDNLLKPRNPLQRTLDINMLDSILTGNNYDEDYKILSKKIRSQGENIPPLFNTYMNLTTTMKVFGTAVNEHFGDVEETGIIVTNTDITENKYMRHIATYKK